MTQPFNYTTPDWAPLERAVSLCGLPADECSNWMWMAEFNQGEHSYKHRDTRHYAVLSADMNGVDAISRITAARRF